VVVGLTVVGSVPTWSVEATELPPLSAFPRFPRFALCVLEEAAVWYGALPELVRAMGQLDAAVSNGSVVWDRRRLVEDAASSGGVDWRVGSLGVSASDALVPSALRVGVDSVYVSADPNV
jgi:hypothetical protein